MWGRTDFSVARGLSPVRTPLASLSEIRNRGRHIVSCAANAQTGPDRRAPKRGIVLRPWPRPKEGHHVHLCRVARSSARELAAVISHAATRCKAPRAVRDLEGRRAGMSSQATTHERQRDRYDLTKRDTTETRITDRCRHEREPGAEEDIPARLTSASFRKRALNASRQKLLQLR